MSAFFGEDWRILSKFFSVCRFVDSIICWKNTQIYKYMFSIFANVFTFNTVLCVEYLFCPKSVFFVNTQIIHTLKLREITTFKMIERAGRTCVTKIATRTCIKAGCSFVTRGKLLCHPSEIILSYYVTLLKSYIRFYMKRLLK
jgi:hypothetical protein